MPYSPSLSINARLMRNSSIPGLCSRMCSSIMCASCVVRFMSFFVPTNGSLARAAMFAGATIPGDGVGAGGSEGSIGGDVLPDADSGKLGAPGMDVDCVTGGGMPGEGEAPTDGAIPG